MFQKSDIKQLSDEFDPRSLLITIENEQGKQISVNKKLSLYDIGGELMSESIPLSVGNYYLTKFIVLNNDDQAIYATPVTGSDKAKFVDVPLPVSFSVTGNKSSQVIPQVISVTENSSASFGYASFSLDIVDFAEVLIQAKSYNQETQSMRITPSHTTIRDKEGNVLATTKRGSVFKVSGYPVDFVGISHGDAAKIRGAGPDWIDGTVAHITSPTVQMDDDSQYIICVEVEDPITGLTDMYCYPYNSTDYYVARKLLVDTSYDGESSEELDVIIETSEGTEIQTITTGELNEIARSPEPVIEQPMQMFYATVDNVNFCDSTIWMVDSEGAMVPADFEFDTENCRIIKHSYSGAFSTTILGINQMIEPSHPNEYIRVRISFNCYLADDIYISLLTFKGLQSETVYTELFGPAHNPHLFNDYKAHLVYCFDLPLDDSEATLTFSLARQGNQVSNLRIEALQVCDEDCY